MAGVNPHLESTGHEPGELSTEERASIDAFARLTPLQRFDQVVRTARFIAAGRNEIRRHERN
jgi:hypothetical protein